MAINSGGLSAYQLGRVPKWFIKDLERLGVRVQDRGMGFFEMLDHIRSDSPQYNDLLDMLKRLGDTRVQIFLGFKRGEPLYCPPCPRGKDFMDELQEQLPKLAVADPGSSRGIACGDARCVVDAVVRMMIDPPECCTEARSIHEGHFILAVEVHFGNIVCLVSVYRRSKLSPSVTESLGA